jgi:hypothetical protein
VTEFAVNVILDQHVYRVQISKAPTSLRASLRRFRFDVDVLEKRGASIDRVRVATKLGFEYPENRGGEFVFHKLKKDCAALLRQLEP